MCFAPEADLVAGVVIGAISVDVVLHHPAPRDRVLAALPPLLAAHSFVEAFVWFAGRGQVGETIGTAATYIYLLIAFVVLPTLVPIAVRARERDRVRRRLLEVLTVVGIFVSASLLWSMLDGPVTATLHPHFISYGVDTWAAAVVVPLYVVATCGAGLLSSSRYIVVFGILNLIAVLFLAWLTTSGLASLWCGWAALTSIAIAMLVRRDELQRARQPL